MQTQFLSQFLSQFLTQYNLTQYNLTQYNLTQIESIFNPIYESIFEPLIFYCKVAMQAQIFDAILDGENDDKKLSKKI